MIIKNYDENELVNAIINKNSIENQLKKCNN